MAALNTGMQTIELDPSCCGQTHSNRSTTIHGNESLEPGCTFTVLHVQFIICPLGNVDSLFVNVISSFHATGTNICLDLGLFWKVYEEPLNRSCPISSGLKMSWLAKENVTSYSSGFLLFFLYGSTLLSYLNFSAHSLYWLIINRSSLKICQCFLNFHPKIMVISKKKKKVCA